MSATMYVEGLRDRTSMEHQRKVAVLRACQEAGVDLPPALESYFKVEGRGLKYVSPDDAVSINLREAKVAREWEERGNGHGYEVDLDKLPPGVKTVRFWVSW